MTILYLRVKRMTTVIKYYISRLKKKIKYKVFKKKYFNIKEKTQSFLKYFNDK